MCLLASACGAASEVGSAAPSTPLALFDATSTTSVLASEEPSPATESAPATPTTALLISPAADSAPSTSLPPDISSTTVHFGPTTSITGPNEEFCAAAAVIDARGPFTTPDDPDATDRYFTTQAADWSSALAVAPAIIASDTQVVATYLEDLRELLAANDFDLFSIVTQVTELEATLSADLARIRVDQFVYGSCDIDPPLAEQATAAFYISLLGSAYDRVVLAELLASAEIFPLDGAMCFVEQTSADAIHVLVGAPATPTQDAALVASLGACQLSIGT